MSTALCATPKRTQRASAETRAVSCAKTLASTRLHILSFTLAVSASASGTFAQAPPSPEVHGTAIVAVVDDFEQHASETQYYIRDADTGKSQRVSFVDRPPAIFRTGALVAAKGDLQGEQLVMHSADLHLERPAPAAPFAMNREDASAQRENAQAPNAPVTFAQRTLVILLNLLDQSAECTIRECDAHVFAPKDSVQSLYAETSYGHVTYTGTTVGPFTIPVKSTDSCPYPYLPTFERWAALADTQLEKAGINLSGYTEKVYVLPHTDPCGNQRGYATIGGSPSLAWIAVWHDPEVFTHEMGHNLGMQHASTANDEYGDHSDIMGNTRIGMRGLDAPHRDQFNWLPPGNIVNVTGGGEYKIAPLELPPSRTSLPQALKIFKPDTNDFYYFSYRQPHGYDTILPSLSSGLYTHGVSIQRFAGPDADDIHTYFVQALTDGRSFTDTANNITVKQVSHDASGAKVIVNTGGPAADVSARTISFASQSVDTASPAHSIVLANRGGAPLTIYSVGITGADSRDFQVTANTCKSSLAAGANCAITVNFAPIATGTRSAFLSIADALGTQEVALSGSGVLTDFAFNPQGSMSETVRAGSTATYVIKLEASHGFTGSVAVSCSVPAAATTCSAAPSSVEAGASTTVKVTTTAHQAVSPLKHEPGIPWHRFTPLLAYLGLLCAVVVFAQRTRRLRFALAVPAAVLLAVLAVHTSGCASAPLAGHKSPGVSPGSAIFGTQAGNYVVTITGTSASSTHTTTVTLTVR